MRISDWSSDVCSSDLLIGESQNRQRREFAIRAEVETPADILRAMYRENPRLCRLEGRIGTLRVGAIADIVLTRVNPLDDIAALAEENAVAKVFQRGHIVQCAEIRRAHV